ncbi:MAG: 2-succinyl-5-enolpyruvyl-6-hydroxy-3-cyclohexene-1-carboxylic-acid synthase [Opitutae bacterium]|nr:2-succinyl-5-enolpyruvyl-6-hydroxy-3-cyclohexene-1-carboxylic-acid synthase [Opitutae bacterium]
MDYRNTNSLWGSVLVETLHRLGLREVVISPGSRSTPLTMAFARHPGIAAIPVLDERSAAFFALGLARQHRRPVALLCTSGTAGANYFPAVIEAQESGVPLLVITADRPPEMRECRSGQTIDQQKLFGGHVNFYHEFAVPQATLPLLRYLRQTTAHAWERTQWPVAGPVHLNAPFRDPLPPIEDGRTAAIREELKGERFFAALRPQLPPLTAPAASFRLGGRGIIVAGQARPGDAAAYAKAVGRISRKLGWPVLADALSPLRHHAHLVPALVTTYDLMARSAALTGALRPAHVLCLHDWPTSKALRQWLQAGDVTVTFVSTQSQNPDALHNRSRVLRCSVESLAGAVRGGAKPRGWLAGWLAADRRLNRGLVRALARTDELFEGRVGALLPSVLPKGTPLFVANSMPVRDLEHFCPANRRRLEVHCNRGANGIDGTLSTALGLAHGNRPTVLLTGDLALLHDTNGFLSGPRFKGSLTVVLINNRGGGIFGHLPVARFDPPFEEFFATPQQADFRKLCAAYAVKHVAVPDQAHLAGLLRRLPARGVRVLEVRTDRKRDAATRQAIFRQLTG